MDPAHFIRLSLAIFLAALALLVAFQMLTGAINLRGLLTDKVSGVFSPGRLQLLAATAMGAGWYLMQALSGKSVLTLPDMPGELLTAIGGSNALYLLGKLRSAYQTWTNIN